MMHGSSSRVSRDTASYQLFDATKRHRRRRRRPGHEAITSRIKRRAPAIAVGIVFATYGIASWTVSASETKPDVTPTSSVVLADEAERPTSGSVGSRGHTRATGAPSSPSGGSASPAQASSPLPSSTRLAPVAGLSQYQMDNAVAIVEVGRQLDLPRHACVVAIAAALQESNLYVLANPAVPESMKLPNQGMGHDHDSIGLFQQRSSWASVDQRMDPRESARQFYVNLVAIGGWERLSVTVAAQRVQRSAFPGAYAKHQKVAEQIVDGIF